MTDHAADPAAVDVVVVGAGLAGLACAADLQAAGIDAVVVEASDWVGGRVRTDVALPVPITVDDLALVVQRRWVARDRPRRLRHVARPPARGEGTS